MRYRNHEKFKTRSFVLSDGTVYSFKYSFKEISSGVLNVEPTQAVVKQISMRMKISLYQQFVLKGLNKLLRNF